MKVLKLGNKLNLPESLPTMRVGLIGKTGTGKTNTAVVMGEHMLSHGQPIVVFDPQGDWWGLRSHFPIAILGGDNGDLPLSPNGGTVAANFVIENRISVLFDLSSMDEMEMVRFATDFAKRIWVKNRQALHIFLDEADLFAPQSGVKGTKTKCLSAWQNVCRRGRSRGLGMTMITQRSAVLNKDLLTQADPLIVHKLVASQDLAAVDAYMNYHGQSKAERMSILASIPKLNPGEAWVLSPELTDRPMQIQVARRKSFDSGATPASGESVRTPKTLAEVDLDALRKSMQATLAEVEKSDPKHLRNEVKRLTRENAELLREADRSPDAGIPMPEFTKMVAEYEERFRQLKSANAVLTSGLAAVADLVRGIQDELPQVTLADVDVPEPAAAKSTTQSRTATSSRPTAGQLRSGLQRILQSIRDVNDLGIDRPSRKVIAAWAGCSSQSGSYNASLGELKAADLVVYPGPGLVELTLEGLAKTEQLLSRADRTLETLHQRWRESPALRPHHVRILDVLIKSYPSPLSRTRIAEIVSASANSGSFNSSLGHLRSLGLVSYPRRGYVMPSQLLFPEELA